MMSNPSRRGTERITKQGDEPNWRSRRWEKPIQEVESPSITLKTEISGKLEDNDEQSQRSRLKEIIRKRMASQSITPPIEKTIEEITQNDENERDLRTRLKKGMIQRTESQSIAQTQTPFIEEMESDEEDEESETEEDNKKRREVIHAYLTKDNENEQVKLEETETDEDAVRTPEEQKKRLIQAYWTSTMKKAENKRTEQDDCRELLHAYSKRTMDNDKGQTERDETETYLRTSMEEEQKPSTWEEYDEEEPFEVNDENEPFEENDDEGKWTTQFSYPTEEEENALFIAFMTGSVEDQKTWIDAKMNLARATTDEETRRREKEILDRIIPTEIVDLDKTFEEGDEEETNDISECQPYDLTEDQEEDFTDEFFDKDKEDKDIQSSESLNIFYQNERRQDEETVNFLSLTTEPAGQFDKEIKDQWRIDLETKQELFKPMDIPTSLHNSPMTPQIGTGEVNKQRIINWDRDIQIEEEQDAEYTGCVQRRSRDNDLFTEPRGCTLWVTKAVCEGLINPKNQPQMDQTKPQDERNINGQDYIDIIILLGRLVPNLWDQELSDEQTFESNDGWFDPIKTLSAHGLKRLPNHFSKVTVATSVNDVIAVNNMNKDPQKRITLGRDMDITVENKINISLGKRPDMWKDESENWPIRLLRSPNKKGSSILMTDPLMPKPLDKTKPTNDLIAWMIKSPDEITVIAKYGNSWCSRIIKGQSDGRQARQNLSLSGPKENFVCILGWRLEDLTKPMNGTLLPWNPHERNPFNIFTEDILLPGNLRTSWKREGNLLFYITACGLGICPRPLLMDPSESFNSELVMEDHRSTKGVILTISKPYTDGTTTISHGTRNKQYELSDGSILDRKTHFVLHKSEQLLASKLITNTMHHPWKNGTIERIYSRLFLATLGYYPKIETSTETRKISLTSSYSTSPITHHHNMFLRKTKSTPILKTPSTFEDENERLNRNINHLQNMIDDMIKEYEYMDRPLKCPHKPESSPITSLTDKSIFLNQRND